MIDRFLSCYTRFQSPTFLCGVFGGGLLLLVLTASCTHSSAPHSAAERDKSISSVSSEALLEDVTRTMNRLDEATVIDLTPPELVLDATTSRNRKEVLANFMNDPREPNGRFDFLVAVTENGQFERLNIGRGDQVRIFVDLGGDEFGKISTVNLVVAERINQNVLRVEKNPFLAAPYFGQLPYPARIEIWRYSNDRLRDLGERFDRFFRIGRAVPGFVLPRGVAPKTHISTAVWEPSPDESALTATLDRLNQWYRDQPPIENWQPSPLVATLPEPYQLYVSPKLLSGESFSSLDLRNMQEAIWARDIGHWAARDGRFTQPLWGKTATPDKNANADLEAATALFDWTVRHIQLDTSEQHADVPHQVWHALLYGRGTLEQRAWVFIRLARQQGLDVVALAVGPEDSQQPPKLLAALVLGEELYLFDPQLGLPLPGPAGQGIATLAQVQADPKLLRQLDLSASEPYRIAAEDLSHVVALVESSPLSLSQRGQQLEEKLVGRARFTVTGLSDPAFARLQKVLGNDSVRLWPYPYQMLEAQLTLSPENRFKALFDEYLIYSIQPWLYKARVMHFQGKFDSEMTQKLFDQETAEKYDDRMARFYYRRSRPPEKVVLDPTRDENERKVLLKGKANASYWLGLLALDDGDYTVAVDFLAQRTLSAMPGGPWTWGAEYNLGRTYELLGNKAEAAQQYELSPESPQSFGNRVRARWLLTGMNADSTVKEAN